MARKKITKEIILVKPSELPKDDRVSLRINTFVKQKLADDKVSLQKLLDDAIDKKLSKIEFETKLTIETKKKP